MTEPQPDTSPGTDLVLSPQLLETFSQMVFLIPDAIRDDQGAARIVEQILNAKSVEELESPWRDRKFPLGEVIRVVSASKVPSDYAGGLPFYLECDCVDTETGEAVVYQTGSVSCTVQLTAAFANEWMPIVVKLVKATKQSANGFYPEHFEIISRTEKRKGK